MAPGSQHTLHTDRGSPGRSGIPVSPCTQIAQTDREPMVSGQTRDTSTPDALPLKTAHTLCAQAAVHTEWWADPLASRPPSPHSLTRGMRATHIGVQEACQVGAHVPCVLDGSLAQLPAAGGGRLSSGGRGHAARRTGGPGLPGHSGGGESRPAHSCALYSGGAHCPAAALPPHCGFPHLTRELTWD